MKRFVVWLVSFALVFTQSFAVAGPHEDGEAAGRAVNPVSRGLVTAPSASTAVPGYTTTPPQTSLYRQPNLGARANNQLLACALAPNDPACQGQITAIESANAPRTGVSPWDPAVAGARAIARNPGTVLEDVASYYAGCTTATVATPPGTVNRMCHRYTGQGSYACQRALVVQVEQEANCSGDTPVARIQLDRDGEGRDHMWAEAQCRVSGDGHQYFRLYAGGINGACVDWQLASFPSEPTTRPQVAANLSPHWSGRCESPFVAVAMPGSGCVDGQCSYTFQLGTPIHECGSGGVRGDQLLVSPVPGDSGEMLPGSASQCYRTSPIATAGDGSPCPAGMSPVRDLAQNPLCAVVSARGRIVGAQGWTLPLAYAEPAMVPKEVDVWTNQCPALDPRGRCAQATAERCVEGPGTRAIGGIPVTRDCWAYERTLTCSAAAATGDDCAPLAAAGCTPAGSTCVKQDEATGACAVYQDTYQCPSAGESITTASNCPSNVFCLGESCFNVGSPADADFARSMTYMEAAREAGVYFDPATLRLFRGEANECRDRLLKNCCYTDGSGAGMSNQSAIGAGSKLVYDVLMNSENRAFIQSGISAISGGAFGGTFTSYGVTVAAGGTALPSGSVVIYSSTAGTGGVGGVVVAVDPWTLVAMVVIYVVMSMMSCDADEGKLALKRGASLCHETGDYCSSSFLGSCMERTHSHCCFNSVLSRIINEQGREQLDKGWGTAKEPDCSGFTIAELQSLDLAAMDFTEFYASLTPQQPNVDGLQLASAGRLPACYYGQGNCGAPQNEVGRGVPAATPEEPLDPGDDGEPGTGGPVVAPPDGWPVDTDPSGWSVQEPFAEDSYWKERLPADTRYAGANDPRNISWQNQASRLTINVDRWTQWVWQASASDPKVTFQVSAAFIGDGANAREGFVTLNLPANAHPDPGDLSSGVIQGWGPCSQVRDSDRHLIVIDPDGRTAHEFWQACRTESGAFQATSYARTDLAGYGINYTGSITRELTGSYHNPAVLSYGWGATRAYGGSALPGLIRQGEVTTGIHHRLALQLPAAILYHDPNNWSAGAIWPATRPDTAGQTGPGHTIKHGQIFAIPRSLDLTRIGLTTQAGYAVARAMQEYGAVVMDQAAQPTLVSDGANAQADGRAIRAAGADMAIIHRYMVPVDMP